jgi:transcriptional regulator with XRE-family HTH domain
MRERRILLGLTQQQIAELSGVTYQQAHKYEKALNRIAAGRLYLIARALGVQVGYFYEGYRPEPSQGRHLSSGCCWNWRATSWISATESIKQRSYNLARALAEGEKGTIRAAESWAVFPLVKRRDQRRCQQITGNRGRASRRPAQSRLEVPRPSRSPERTVAFDTNICYLKRLWFA